MRIHRLDEAIEAVFEAHGKLNHYEVSKLLRVKDGVRVDKDSARDSVVIIGIIPNCLPPRPPPILLCRCDPSCSYRRPVASVAMLCVPR